MNLQDILKNHNLWILGEVGKCADLSDADLSGADLSGANLSGADLSGANLSDADLSGADLSRADLSGADLSGANLSGANLSRANLSRANLSRANLSRADLSGADLSDANLSRADLSDADLSDANLPSPQMVLLAYWGKLSDNLTAKAMSYDAASHPYPSKFDEWAKGGECPYYGVKTQRACNFRESRSLWDPNVVCPRPWDLMVGILREKCVTDL